MNTLYEERFNTLDNNILRSTEFIHINTHVHVIKLTVKLTNM